MFGKLLQRFLIFFFTTACIVILIVGTMRSRTISPSDLIAPATQNQPSERTQTPPAVATAVPKTQPIPSSPAPVSATYTGQTYRIPWGNVTVSASLEGSKIVSINTPDYPNSPPSRYARTYLIDQSIKANSANIQGVSGATYTSLAFQRSLESALAQAK